MRGWHLIALPILLQSGAGFPAAPDEPWFNPPGGTWAPSARVVARMKSDLNGALDPLLAKEPAASAPPARYWFQYRGQGSGAHRAIELVGHVFPVPARARQEFFNAFIAEGCYVYARYLPAKRKFDPLGLGRNCPRRTVASSISAAGAITRVN